MERIPIKYHHSEKASGVPQALIRLIIDRRSEFGALRVTANKDNEIDYVISDQVGFERKTMSDLVGSIEEGKIPMQLKRIIDAGMKPIFLVEGILPDSTQTKMIWRSIYGYISWISRTGISVIHAMDYEHAAIQILKVGLDVKKGEIGVMKVPVIKTKADHPILQRLMAIEGVGEELAGKIRSEYDYEFSFIMDCYRQLKFHKSKLMRIKGIGRDKADTIARDATRTWKGE